MNACGDLAIVGDDGRGAVWSACTLAAGHDDAWHTDGRFEWDEEAVHTLPGRLGDALDFISHSAPKTP